MVNSYRDSLRLSNYQFDKQPSLRGLVNNHSYYWLVQILGFIPKIRSFSRQASLTHELKLPLSAISSICSSRSSSKRIVRRVLLFCSYGFLLFSSCIGSNHYKDERHKKAIPRSGGSWRGRVIVNQGNNNQKSRLLDVIRAVKQSAVTHWQLLLPVCGVDVPLKGKHGACPICGGTDRFHFIDDNYNGDWHCRQCDGLDLVARTKGISIFAAAKLVAGSLALPLPEPKPAKEKPRTTKSIAERIMALVEISVMGKSQYLTKKGLQCPNQRLLKDGSLLLVAQTLDGKITGGQTIKPNGEKRLVSGTQKKGSFIPVSEITGIPDTIIITEGYATALTVSQLHDGVVLAAIDEGNLFAVAEQVRNQWPTTKIILAADNDWHKQGELDKNGKLKRNIGKIAAEKTAKAMNGWVTFPLTEYKADWDDYRQSHGIEAAKKAFSNGLYQFGGKAPVQVVEEVAVIHVEKPKKANNNLAQMAASQRGALLVERYGKVAVSPESEMVHHYNGMTWETVSDNELRRAMVARV